ncbi:MAG: CoA ester lyase [Candidatus Korarchaeota archaeon]|nr:CoA ester lyase [Candidatus Korarchaeota archaeon]
MTFLARSLLFVPANSWRLMLSSLRSGADVVVLDMEDAVPIGEKETARWLVREFLKEERGKFSGEVFVRVNSSTIGMLEDDLVFTMVKGLDGIVLPKTERIEDIKYLEERVQRLEEERGLEEVRIIPLIESAMGVERSLEIALSSHRICALSFGMGDFLRDLGRSVSDLSDDEIELLYARSKVSVASTAAKIPALDTPFLGLIIDREGVKRQALLARGLGYKGKYAIHPSHIPIINEVFTPSEKEIKEAEEIVKAYEEAVRRGLGAASHRGMMIDRMNYEQARALLEIVREIKSRSERKSLA